MALTKRQKEVLDFIAGFLDEKGYSPSYLEVAEGMGLASLATVHKHIQSLEAKHYVRKSFNQSRSLELGPKYFQDQRRQRHEPAAGLDVPLAGRIAAGVPVEAVAAGESLGLGDFLGQGDTYALEVRGDSMIEDHICDGDYVLIERTQDVRDGEIVVALVRGAETTLKRLYREEGGMVRLQPGNPSMSPIVLPVADIEIQGRVLAVLRKYK